MTTTAIESQFRLLERAYHQLRHEYEQLLIELGRMDPFISEQRDSGMIAQHDYYHCGGCGKSYAVAPIAGTTRCAVYHLLGQCHPKSLYTPSPMDKPDADAH